MSPTPAGRLFHSAGAAIWNNLSSRVFFIFPMGNCNNSSSEERSWYLHFSFNQTRLQIEDGASWYIALNVKTKILNSIRSATGSQCKENKAGVIWLNLWVEHWAGQHHFEYVVTYSCVPRELYKDENIARSLIKTRRPEKRSFTILWNKSYKSKTLDEELNSGAFTW